MGKTWHSYVQIFDSINGILILSLSELFISLMEKMTKLLDSVFWFEKCVEDKVFWLYYSMIGFYSLIGFTNLQCNVEFCYRNNWHIK